MRRFFTPVTLLAFSVLTFLFAIGTALGSALEVFIYWNARYGSGRPRENGGQAPSALHAGLSALLALFYVAASFTMLRYRRLMQRRLRGECVRCGYSLTGNVSGVCPECGTVLKSGRLAKQI